MCVKNARVGGGKFTYEDLFYQRFEFGKHRGEIHGFPHQIGSWCKKIKYENGAVDIRRLFLQKISDREKQGENFGIPNDKRGLVQQSFERSNDLFTNRSSRERESIVQYLGIALDEPIRIARHEGKKGIVLPLVKAGWTESMCREWCEKNDLLSPIYTTATRGGCWFCHNQGVDQLRLLRKNYPEYWKLLLKWDNDSPVTFKADGHTVHDYDRRFQLEDELLIPTDRPFRWSMLEEDLQIRLI